jgi:hypothetical protein
MSIKSWIYSLLFILYLVGIAQKFGLVLGLYVSVLVASFFVLASPLVSYALMLVSFFSSRHFLRYANINACAWIVLLIINVFTVQFFPYLYLRTQPTTFLYHVLIVPISGVFPVTFTGLASFYHWFIGRYAGSHSIAVYNVIGAFGLTLAFYFFFNSSYYEQFVISLNASSINY